MSGDAEGEAMSVGLVRGGRGQGSHDEAGEQGRRREFLGFLAGSETFGVPLEVIREILRPTVVTHVPRAPSAILGVTSVRGRITTVVDLRALLGVELSGGQTRWSRFLLVDLGDEVVAALVDRVVQVYRLGDAEIEPADAIGADLSAHVLGIGRPRDGRGARAGPGPEFMMVLLDPEVLFRRTP